jgi:uncharacterized repeat protein (TIGR01451 family)
VTIGVVVLVLAAVSTSSTLANTITVSNTNDSGVGSLRQAIASASAGDTIVVPAGAGHYAVSSAELVIGESLTIAGSGARSTVIDAMGGTHRVLKITAGTVAISGVTIAGGNTSAVGNGGGILIEGGGLTLSDSSVSGNTAGAEGNDGGGIEAKTGATLTINASTIADNVAYNGGGLYVSGTTVITDSTIADNHAGDHTNNGDGGGLQNNNSLTLINDTIAGNESFNGHGSGGGIWGTATVKNTIIADNHAGNTSNEELALDNCHEAVTSTGPNLENGSECAFAAHGGYSYISSQPLTTSQLTPLTNNGGPTDTMAPAFSENLAIDHGTNEGCPATDQRGGARPQPPGGTCDIGAVEYGSLADVGVSQVVSPSPVTVGETLTYTVTVSNHGPGPDPAAGTVVTDTLPADATLVSASASQGSCSGSVPVSCSLGTLEACIRPPFLPPLNCGQATVTIAVRPTLLGIATNTAMVSAIPLDPEPANNSSQLETMVLAVPKASPPVVENVAQSNRIWREGRKLAQISRRKTEPRVGTTFSFTLNEQASVSFSFTQRVGGRNVKGKCLAQTKRNRNRIACKHTITRGTLFFIGHQGTNRVVFEGRISPSKKLKPGRYTVVITAINYAGVRSAPESLTFIIVK